MITDDWCAQHFDHLAPEFSEQFDETLASMREKCPVVHSDRYGGFWVVTRYEDVLRVLQDWQVFTSTQKVSIPPPSSSIPALPQETDPPLHRAFRRVLNVYLTPAWVAPYEPPTRQLVTRLIDDFIETGRCEFMEAFAEQLPKLSFFEQVLHAPAGDIGWLHEQTKIAEGPKAAPDFEQAWENLHNWVDAFVDQRRAQPARGDIVDAVLSANIQGRPITRKEIIGTIELLMFGGFGTTAAALGNIMIRFAKDPAIPVELRSRPKLITEAMEEFLRLDAPVVALARTATQDTVLGDHTMHKGEKVLFQLASANRDEAEFHCPSRFELDRQSNRHLAFGAGPHRCAGSNLARLNLRIAIEELTARLDGIRLQSGAEPIEYRTAFMRTPAAVPISFTPGARLSG
jgi:cytochrome P450